MKIFWKLKNCLKKQEIKSRIDKFKYNFKLRKNHKKD
jgi:hypothetical protein